MPCVLRHTPLACLLLPPCSPISGSPGSDGAPPTAWRRAGACCLGPQAGRQGGGVRDAALAAACIPCPGLLGSRACHHCHTGQRTAYGWHSCLQPATTADCRARPRPGWSLQLIHPASPPQSTAVPPPPGGGGGKGAWEAGGLAFCLSPDTPPPMLYSSKLVALRMHMTLQHASG